MRKKLLFLVVLLLAIVVPRQARASDDVQYIVIKTATETVAVALAGMVEAMAWSPVQVGLFGGNVQICAPETEIAGLRLNLPYSENDDVSGLDLGIVRVFAAVRKALYDAQNEPQVAADELVARRGVTLPYPFEQRGLFGFLHQRQLRGVRAAYFHLVDHSRTSRKKRLRKKYRQIRRMLCAYTRLSSSFLSRERMRFSSREM